MSTTDWNEILGRIRRQGSLFRWMACYFIGVNENSIKDLNELRDLLEVLPVNVQGDFVNQFVPLALNALEEVSVSIDGANFAFRNAFIECMRVLPASGEAVRTFIDELMRCVLKIVCEDVDLNAAEAMQLFIEMNKAFRASVEHFVSSFLDFILEIANNFEKIVKINFDEAKKGIRVAHLSRWSFRLLHDAPVMIVLVFQLHRRFINEYIPRFVPVVIKLLEFDMENPSCILPEVKSLDEIGNEPQSPIRSVFNDFISCQVKVLSFLAYIARGFASTLREYKDVIPAIIIRLLSKCPPEGAPARKELLVAIRHILSTELRQTFVPHIETLMDEKLLLGEGYTAFYVFRPAAYSMLADLIHHVRLDLTHDVINKVIAMYSRALHDPTLPNGIQTMSIKLLLNLVDVIVGDRFPLDLRRIFLMKILTTIILKFEWIRKIVAELLIIRGKIGDPAQTNPTAVNNLGMGNHDEKQYDPFFDDPLNARPIPTDNVALDSNRDNIRDLKFQLKTLINGMKNLVLALRTLPLPSSDIKNSSSPSSTYILQSSQAQLQSGASSLQVNSGGFTPEEAERFLVNLFKDGVCCFDLFHFKFNVGTGEPISTLNSDPGNTNSGQNILNPIPSATIPADEKDLMDQFAYVFSLLEPSTFHDIISANMDFLIEQAKDNIALVSIPQYFLAISGVSKGFATILARHLMDHFEEIGSASPVAGAIILRLFKLLFLAVSVYPEENENVLQPHLSEIILSCFRLYPRAATPSNYFILLRSLFRSIGGGRFDSLYKEVLPLLQTILDELSHLSPSTSDPILRDMYVELCLTTPVRLSNLLPYLSYLMKPVLLALQSGGDLVNQGLRTFELCLDNLTPDFLEPILTPVFPDLLACLWKMLRPPPANQLHAHTAVRLLGKLGGKARRYLITTPNYNYRKSVGTALTLTFTFDMPQTCSIDIPCDSIARTAMTVLNTPSRDLHIRQRALLFLKRAIAAIFHAYGISESFEPIAEIFAVLNSPRSIASNGAVKPSLLLNALNQQEIEEACHAMALGSNAMKLINPISENGINAEASKQLLCEIVCSLFDAYGHGEKILREEIHSLTIHLYRFITISYISRLEHRVVSCIDYEVLCDIIVEYATSQNEAQITLAWELIKAIHEQYVQCIPDKDTQFEIKAFFLIADKIISACFRSNTWQRISACRLVSRLCDLELSVRFFWHHEIRLIRGVLYVMKSLPSGMSAKYSEELTGVVFKVLRLANRIDEQSDKGEEFFNHRRQYFDQVMLALVTELSNPNEIVRDAVKASFQLLSNIQGCEVTDLLIPLKARVYGPIFSKPLRALPVHVQVGYIDAITYCLSLRPPLLEINDELFRLINEAITVVESEEQPNPTIKVNPLTSLQNLKIVCIRLLSTCLSGGEFQQAKLHPLRNQIVAVFFKTLYARQTELVEVSRSALEQVMAQQHKLPTELLQNGLRPVLQSLGEPRHLNLTAVEGLRRILQLFSHFFKAEIGRKLLDHLHSWADQHHNDSGNTNIPATFPDVKVITAIMDLFCLLPSCGPMFVGELVQTVLQLENVLKKRASSPFRPVLLKFMELYPVDGVNFLLENFTTEPIVELYVSLVSLPSAAKLINEMIRCLDTIKKAFAPDITVPSSFEVITMEMLRNYLSLLKIVYSRCTLSIKPVALDDHANLLVILWDYLAGIKVGSPASIENHLARLVFEVSIAFISAHPGQVNCAFLPLRVFVLPFVFDTTELPSFYRTWIRRCSPERLRGVILQWLNMYALSETKFMIKARAIRMIILPFIAEFTKFSDADANMIMDETVFSKIEEAIWRRDCRSCADGSCVMAIEELQFTFSLMQAMRIRGAARLNKYQQRIFSFLFNRIQSLDCSVKYSTLYTLAMYLIESGSPAEQILRVFASLLKAPTADIRAVLRRSFDLLLPYFVKQDDKTRRKAVNLATHALTRDGYLLTLVLSLWQCIHDHTNELFLLAPSLIAPLIYSFSRCAPIAFASAESRQIPIDLVSTLYEWHCLLGINSPFIKMSYLIDSLLNGLIRLLCSLPDYNDTVIFDRGLEVLKKYLNSFYGGNYTLKLNSIERLTSVETTDDNIAMITCGMRLLTICISMRADFLVPSELIQYEKWIRSLIDRVNGKLLPLLKNLLSAVFSKFHSYDVLPSVVEDFRENLQSIISEGLNNCRNLGVIFTSLTADTYNVLSMESIMLSYVRALNKVVRDHISFQGNGTNMGNGDNKQLDVSYINCILIPGIEFGLRHLGAADFPRGQFFATLHILWEQSNSIEILTRLLETVFDWVKNDGTVPSLREKVELLLVPCKVEQINDPRILGLFLDIVYEIYSRPAFARTELRARLEGAFLRGLRSESESRREKFSDLLDANIPRSLISRIHHVFETQRWELAGSSYWISLAIDILIRSAHETVHTIALDEYYTFDALENRTVAKTIRGLYDVLYLSTKDNARNIALLISMDDQSAHSLWVALFASIWSHFGPDTQKFLNSRFIRILSNDDYLCQSQSRPSVMETLVESLSNCHDPIPSVPSFLIAYAMKTYSCWYPGSFYLEKQYEQLPADVCPSDAPTKEPTWIELISFIGKMYGMMGEIDYMFGAYRRGFLLSETNIALSFDQLELVPTAQKLIETSMSKCRSGTVPFSEAEFCVWEDCWISAAKSLQQWDLLTEVSRADSNPELGLECLWRLADWGATDTHVAANNLSKGCSPTTRSKFFEAFLALSPPNGIQRDQSERVSTFQNAIEEAIQLGLYEWISLPQQPCPAHANLLHLFQMLVEIQESVVLYSNLSTGATNALGRPQFLADLKGLLTAWRERLPNQWDDMQMWSDILAWRQHVFSAMNTAFAPLIGTSGSNPGIDSSISSQNPNNPGTGSNVSGVSSHPFAFRGYHEMAWLINRFAHVARKNNLIDVCLSFLNRIYTLPNIEIQDAFLKLREQAKCYMANPADLPTALEVVNATNLNYFSGLQKGEFFALRSVILSRLGMLEEANRVFAQAVQIDLNMGHGWAAWGRFNDQRFSQNQDMNYALNAINCFLQAATLFKAHKSRRFLARILWLLTFEDSIGSLGKSFEMYNHDLPTWFWVSFIPQLLTSLSRQEQRQARFLLMKIAKNYPQALYLPLRTFHEDCRLAYGSRIIGTRALSVSEMSSGFGAGSQPGIGANAASISGGSKLAIPTDGTSPQLQVQTQSIEGTPNASNLSANGEFSRKHPVDSTEELLSILKTGYPLLALTMENVMEHIVHRLRSTVDEDFYRVLTSLIGEAYQHIMNSSNTSSILGGSRNTAVSTPASNLVNTTNTTAITINPAGSISNMMEASLRRVYTMICNSNSLGPLYKNDFEEDFMSSFSIGEKVDRDPNRVLEKLFIWRAKLEPSLKRHAKQLVLDGMSRFLAEFEYHRYDEIDVPGQYLQMRDGNQDFVKIGKFDAQVPVIRRHGASYRRLVIRGNDGVLYPFAVQNPAGRQTRREERVLQLFRFLDVALKRGLSARRRNLFFNVPAVVPISAHVRLVADDPSYVSFEEVLGRFCEINRVGSSDEIFLYFKEQLLAALPLISGENPKINVELLNIRTEIFTNIISTIVPGTILSKFMEKCSVSAADKWQYRRDFTRQLGTTIFLNYVFSIGHRFIHKIGFSRKSAAAVQSEVLPMVTASGQLSLIEIVPFRFTPNLQDYVTPIGTDGILSSSIVACARSLAKADSDLSEYLSIFIRDELLLWYLNYCSMQQQQQQGGQTSEEGNKAPVMGEIVENPFEKLEAAGIDEKAFFSRVQQNCELIMKRAQTLSCVKEEEQVMEQSVPLFQSVLDLISSATNLQKLAQMDGHWHPWF